LYAYVFLETAKMGIDVVGESQLVGYPSQFPSVTMLDWHTGAPNARFEVLRLLHDHVRIGATLMETKLVPKDMDALAFEDEAGRHLLLVNKRDRSLKAEIPEEFDGGRAWTVDTMHATARPKPLKGREQTLGPFAVIIDDAAGSR
jgi:hypothetical protein